MKLSREDELPDEEKLYLYRRWNLTEKQIERQEEEANK